MNRKSYLIFLFSLFDAAKNVNTLSDLKLWTEKVIIPRFSDCSLNEVKTSANHELKNQISCVINNGKLCNMNFYISFDQPTFQCSRHFLLKSGIFVHNLPLLSVWQPWCQTSQCWSTSTLVYLLQEPVNCWNSPSLTDDDWNFDKVSKVKCKFNLFAVAWTMLGKIWKFNKKNQYFVVKVNWESSLPVY